MDKNFNTHDWKHQMHVMSLQQLTLLSTDEDPALREKVVWELYQRDTDEARDVLFAMVEHDPDEELQWGAAIFLAWQKDTRILPFFRTVLGGSDANKRAIAARVLGQLGDQESADAMLNLLEDGETDSSEVMEGLGWLKEKRVLPTILHFLNMSPGEMEDWDIYRSSAALAAGLLGDIQFVEPLIKALNDPSGDVQAPAAWALGELGDSRAVQPLIEALSTPTTEPIAFASIYDALATLGVPMRPKNKQPK